MNTRDYQIINKLLQEIDVIEDLAHKYQTLKMGDVWITLIEDIPNVKYN